MRHFKITLLAGTALWAQPASAADVLRFGPAPAWVQAKTIPEPKATEAPVALLLHDQQTSFDGGKITTFTESAFRIQTPQGLAAGNLSIVWQPATETVTVHKLQIRRGDKIIDVLANGQTFTVLRRETNLEAATLDGTLTANIQPEGLQQGDVIDFATTVEHADPVLKGHVETTFAGWNGVPFALGHATVQWPSGRKVSIRESGPLPAPVKFSRGGSSGIEITAANIQPVIAPSGAPRRFAIGRLAEASDFASWGEVAELMAPLFRQAAVLPASGPLHDEVERIRASTADPKKRAEQALALVQDRVRYVALLMGQGGYVPAPAETTWSRRFGDCKAKTALLLAMLHALGIEAEPVVVQSKLGDAIADRLPSLALFDHVLVRAHIGGRTYWLDGTRSGDTALDDIQTPDFGWGLPLTANAALVHIVPGPLERPDSDRRIAVDASAGMLAPATIDISTIYRGDAAVVLNTLYAQASEQQRDQAMRKDANDLFDNFAMSGSSLRFDKDKRELTIEQKGSAKLHWDDGWYYVPTASLGYNPDLQRAPGPLHDAPFATDYPNYDHRLVTIRFPRGFAAGQQPPAPVSETLLGKEYRRTQKIADDVLTVESSERSIVPELSYKQALAEESRLRKLNDDDVYVRLPDGYHASAADVKAELAETPTSAKEFLDRGVLLLNSGRYDEAISDFTESNKLDPKNAWAVANRAISYAWKNDAAPAERDIAAAEKIDPGNAVAERAKGLIALTRRDYRGAIAAFSKSLEAEPKSGFALIRRGMSYHALGDDDKALADLEAAVATEHNPDLRLTRAEILVQRGDRDAAAREAKLVQSENPGSAAAMAVAGRIYARLAMKAEASAAFERALAIKPSADTYLNRADARPLQDYAGRLADLDAALKLEPDNVNVLAEKAEQLAITGKLTQAVAIYDRLIKALPENRPLALNRAVLMYKAGARTEASKLLDAYRRDAKTATDFNSLCWEKATRGVLLDSALQDCEEAHRLAPDDGSITDSLAFVQLRLGKMDDALALYDQALAKVKAQSASYMGRAIAYARKGNASKAEADRTEAIRLDPDAETRFREYGVTF